MDSLLNAIEQYCLAYPVKTTYWLGFSGGLDSTVLLHLMHRLQTKYAINLHAVHINHGLSPNADTWQTHCATLCEQWHISFITKKVNILPDSDQSPEDQARLLRYGVFTELMQENAVLLTAHQQDDQAETVFLQLLRGAGPKGLAAMPRRKKWGRGWHARPLLDFTRSELQQYAEENHLQWINDESNQDTHYPRNFLRQTIFPLLKTHWPSLTKTVARTADHCAVTQDYIQEKTHHILNSIRGEIPKTILVDKLLALDAIEQQFVLRAWFSELGVTSPPLSKLLSIQKNLLTARNDKSPCVLWGNVSIRRYQKHLYVLAPSLQHDSNKRYLWEMHQPLLISDVGELRAELMLGHGLIVNTPVTVRFRQGGEKIKIHGHHHTLKSLFQTWQIPPWERDKIPLIYVEEKLVAVVGFCIADEYQAKTHQMGWVLTLCATISVQLLARTIHENNFIL